MCTSWYIYIDSTKHYMHYINNNYKLTTSHNLHTVISAEHVISLHINPSLVYIHDCLYNIFVSYHTCITPPKINASRPYHKMTTQHIDPHTCELCSKCCIRMSHQPLAISMPFASPLLNPDREPQVCEIRTST